MMNPISIEQALFTWEHDSLQPRARSSGFLEEWLAEAERLCEDFGAVRAGVSFPACLFVHPLGKNHVAVVQVAARGESGFLSFFLLILPRDAHRAGLNDPFCLAEQFPPSWDATGELPSLSWSPETLPARTVEDVRGILQRPDGALLLGAAQVLVDGGKLVFVRATPALDLVRTLWALLPNSTRAEIWPATFAPDTNLSFDLVAVPRADAEKFARHVSEETAAAYPEGRYELNLQIAAEANDQAAINDLFARRSLAQTWRLGWMLLAVALALAIGMQVASLIGGSGNPISPPGSAIKDKP